MKRLGIVLILIALAAGAAWWLVSVREAQLPETSGTLTTFPNTVTTPEGVTFGYPNTYGLAVTKEQVLVSSYIPPCDEGFDYCLYRSAADYASTNFESAGIRVKHRTDLGSQSSCLITPPSGFALQAASSTMKDGYATSVFGSLGDAGAGHYASGVEYRLYFGTTCYEFETRIGETQFANYPAGTKTEFTATDRARVFAELRSLLESVTLPSGIHPVFLPSPADAQPVAMGGSGIRGSVTLGPTCPVERDPPEPGCADKPYATAIAVFRKGSDTPVVVGSSDKSGIFEFALPKGSYILKATGGTTYPRCPNQSAEVTRGYTTILIACDSGIR